MLHTILLVEDETAIRDMIRFALSQENFQIMEAANAKEAEQQIAKQIPDLMLLDWMLPGMTGIEFTKKLKKDPLTQHILIIMLTARAEEENKLKGLDTGADDYMTKPFSPRELIARIKAVLRRGPLVLPNGIIQIDDLSLNVNTHQVSIAQQAINLAPIEYKLLHFFMTHQNRVCDRNLLLDYVWGREDYVDDRTVDAQVKRLREKLKTFGYDKYIKTLYGTGYQFSREKT